MKWEPLAADHDLTGATVYRHPSDATAGTWYVPQEGPVVHRTVDGNLQLSVYDRAAFDEPDRFVKVQSPSTADAPPTV